MICSCMAFECELARGPANRGPAARIAEENFFDSHRLEHKMANYSTKQYLLRKIVLDLKLDLFF